MRRGGGAVADVVVLSAEEVEAVRELIWQENQMINHRLTWFGAFQGFLFAALGLYATRPGPASSALLMVVAALGVATAVPVMVAARGAARKIAGWTKLVPHYGVDPDAHRGAMLWLMRALLPWHFLPVVVALAWAVVAWLLHFGLLTAAPCPTPLR